METLTWPGKEEFFLKEKSPLYDPETGQVDMFVKAHNNLKYYLVLGAGHAVSIVLAGS